MTMGRSNREKSGHITVNRPDYSMEVLLKSKKPTWSKTPS